MLKLNREVAAGGAWRAGPCQASPSKPWSLGGPWWLHRGSPMGHLVGGRSAPVAGRLRALCRVGFWMGRPLHRPGGWGVSRATGGKQGHTISPQSRRTGRPMRPTACWREWRERTPACHARPEVMLGPGGFGLGRRTPSMSAFWVTPWGQCPWVTGVRGS